MEINVLEKIAINGADQWLLQRGKDSSKPVVLFVHGGPGSPLMWFSRAWDEKFVNDFIIVHWDQRGAGKSYDPSLKAQDISLPIIVADGLKVADYLRTKYSQKSIMVVGHSWGSIVASQMVTKAPLNFSSLILVGTAADMKATNELRYQLLKTKLAENKDQAGLKALEGLGFPPYNSDGKLKAFGELFLNHIGWKHTSRKLSMVEFGKAVETSKDYSRSELENADKGMSLLLDCLLPFLNSYNASDAVPSISIPVYFVQGRYDLNTPTKLAESYFQKLYAHRGKQWIEFEESAHFPMYEEPEKFLNVLKQASASE